LKILANILVLFSIILFMLALLISDNSNVRIMSKSFLGLGISQIYDDEDLGRIYLTKKLDVFTDTIKEYYWSGNIMILGDVDISSDLFLKHLENLEILFESDSIIKAKRALLKFESDKIFFYWFIKNDKPTTITYAYKYEFTNSSNEPTALKALNIVGNNYIIEEAFAIASILFYGERKKFHMPEIINVK